MNPKIKKLKAERERNVSRIAEMTARNEEINKQVKVAIEEADVILFVVDVLNGITDLDMEVAQILRRCKRPVIVVANMLFQSVGKAGRATFLACCRQGVFFIPLILILPRTHGLFGVEICQPIADVLTFLVSLPFLIAFLQQLGRMDDAEQSKTAS